MRILSDDELALLAENASSEEARIWSEIEGRAPEMSISDIAALSEVQESWDQIHAAAVELQEWRAGRITLKATTEGTTADDSHRMGEIHDGSTLLPDHAMSDTCEGTPVGVKEKS